jgi:hypothetical protein
MPDPLTVAAGLSALKPAFDTMRSVIGLIRDTKDLLPNDQKTEAITAALATAESSSKIAEAEVANALGYELCRAHFPPVIMLAIGYHTANESAFSRTGKTVFECPECKANSAGPFSFGRTLRPAGM